MTQSAMVRGFAKWAAKEMTKEFTAGCPTRIMFDTFTRLADASPALAVNMALVKYPSIAPIVSTVKDAETFDVAWNALTESVEANGFLPFDVKELPFGPVRVFRIKKADLDAMRAEMERAYKEEVAAAKAVEAAGAQAAQGEAR